MLTITELENILANVKREYGADSKIVLQLYDDYGNIQNAAYCLGGKVLDDGTIILDNWMGNK